MIRTATDPTIWAIAMAAAMAIASRPRRPSRRLDAPTTDPHRLLDDREITERASLPHTADREITERASFPHTTDREITGRASFPHTADSAGRRAASGDDATSAAQWCEALARSVRGGASLATALATTPAPRHGANTVETLVSTFQRTGNFEVPTRGISSHLALALAVVSAALDHGGPCAEPLDRAAGVLRGRAAELAERSVHSAQARLSAQVMSILPVAMLTLLLATSASVRAAVTSPVGATALVTGAVANLVGWWWMRRIIERSAR